MSSIYIRYPSFGAATWQDPVDTAADLPLLNNVIGDVRITLDTDTLYVWNGVGWIAVATPGAAIAIDGLIGDVLASGPGVVPATVAFVGGSTAANVNTATIAANAATSSNTPNTIVKRDGSGNFSAGTITANLIGSSTTFTGSLTGDVTGTQSATVVSFVGGSSAANVNTATIAANAATSSNTPNTIVKRDGSGNFSAGTIIASLIGTASGNVTTVTASTPLASSGGTTPNITIQQSNSTQDGYLSSTDWNTFNNKQSTLTFGNLTDTGTDGITITNGTGAVIGTGTSISQQLSDSTHNGYLSSTDWSTFNNKAPINSPAFTGIPTAPTAGVGTSTTQLATTAFVLSQGFLSSTGAMPVAYQSSTTVVTSATTTYVTAITTTITTTATSAPVSARAAATFTVTGAVPTVAKIRVSINGVAGQEQLLSLTAVTTNYIGTAQYISANLGPGTYTVLFEIARNSGTGTVSFFEGSLAAIALQGTNSNGITQLTGALQAGPGSGSQALTGVLPVANGGTNLSSTTINQILYSSANNVIAGLATVNTGALVTSSTGVPSITSGGTANRVLRTNGTTVSFAQVAAATDISGTLAVANGGTGLTAMFASTRVPFSNGTTFAADGLFLYQTANTRFIVGQGGGTGRINGTVSLTDPSPGDLAGNFFSRTTTNACVNIQNENTLTTLDMTNSGGTTLGANILAQASRGTLAARTQSIAGDSLFTINANGRTASAFSAGLAATLSIITTDTVTDTTNGGEMIFSTTTTGSANPVERLRIKNSGESVFAGAVATARYTTTAKNALTPVGGWVVFDTTLNQLSYYNGTTWINL